MSDLPAVGIGHNQPPVSEQLPIVFSAEVEFVAEMLAAAETLPPKIGNESDLEPVVGTVKRARAARKKIDDKRKEIKAPFDEAGRSVNTFFNAQLDKLDKLVGDLTGRVTAYNNEQEAIRRREMAKQREEIEAQSNARLQEAADATNSLAQDIATDEAERLAQESNRLAQTARKSSADLTRTRTTEGTASTQKRWAFTVDDFQKIPLEDLRPYLATAHIEAAIRGYVRAHRDTRPLPGVRIYQESKAVIR